MKKRISARRPLFDVKLILDISYFINIFEVRQIAFVSICDGTGIYNKYNNETLGGGLQPNIHSPIIYSLFHVLSISYLFLKKKITTLIYKFKHIIMLFLGIKNWVSL